MKKIILILMFLFGFCVFVFSQSEYRYTVKINNEKLYLAHVAVFEDFYGNRSKFRRVDGINIKNKTNFEMEVKISYSVEVWDNNTDKVLRSGKKDGEIIILKPQEDKFIQPLVEYRLEYRLNHYFFIRDLELIHFKVNEKNYEIPW